MNVTRLMVGEPRGPELRTQQQISSVPCELQVVRALQKSVLPKWKLPRSRIKAIGGREEQRAEQILDELQTPAARSKWKSAAAEAKF